MTRETAVEDAVIYCIDQGILTDFLTANRAGVLGMLRLLTEYDEKAHMRRLERDTRIEGRKQDILKLLDRIGQIPEDIGARIDAEEDMDILWDWLVAAAKATDMDDFQKKVAGTSIERQ